VKLGVNIKNGNNPERVEFDSANWGQFNPLSGVAKLHSGLFKFNPFRVLKLTLLT
jgi:hypothetical protein